MNAKHKKYAVVDLEATSARSDGKIIQIGIVIVEAGKIVAEYATDVNPHEPLDNHIIELTGITDQQLAQAPDFSQVAGQVYDLIADCIFVAHNVTFDANFLAEALFFEGYELRTPRVDTVELAQVFFPSFEKYNLSFLAKELSLDLEQAHTAIQDAQATAQLLMTLQDKIRSLPRQTVELLLRFSDALLYETYLVLEECLADCRQDLPKGYTQVAQLVVPQPRPLLKKRRLSQEWSHNLALLGLEERPLQEQMADWVRTSLDDGRITGIQAPAGLGKTYAYLLGIFMANPSQQVVLCVPTKALQDQLVQQELQQLAQVFHVDFQSLKSPRDLIKLDAFYDSLAQQDNRLIQRFKMQLIVWLLETQTGDLSEIRQWQRVADYIDGIRHDGKLKAGSLFTGVDFWQRAYERGKEVPLLVTNHAYLLTRIEDDKAFLTDKIVVIDEAQRMYLATEQFSCRRLELVSFSKRIAQVLKENQDILTKRLLEDAMRVIEQLLADSRGRAGGVPRADLVQALQQDIRELPEGVCDDEKRWAQSGMGYFQWYTEMRAEQRLFWLEASPEKLSLFSAYLPTVKKLYLVSATLAISPQVNLMDLLGFAREKVDLHVIETPPKANQVFYIDRSMPEVHAVSRAQYVQALLERLHQLYQLGQRGLVLFTSRQLLMETADALTELAIPFVSQLDFEQAKKAKQRFDEGEGAFLLGTGSFWEGVDFAQQDRLVLVITHLPFDNPQDPLMVKMSAFLEERGLQSFSHYSLPHMLLRLQQAIGRTNRRDNQKSAVLLLDNRFLHKGYGEVAIAYLKQYLPIKNEEFPEILRDLSDFLL
ncbi:bifunctional DnaQ family exonuclease/ATP-dependent helicase [Streptococcus sp. DD12]|uniref:bifunctional DnaQ family exonuclease/ATP-dependent helicase n=1 Tax=Streptococcus sp. DD12 TaxID=1777880 RepID=UPI00082F2818|nr:bifunctional DnaQ family exonuclease/ATP-dependent helicase [Streptococcus sp. DD12]